MCVGQRGRAVAQGYVPPKVPEALHAISSDSARGFGVRGGRPMSMHWTRRSRSQARQEGGSGNAGEGQLAADCSWFVVEEEASVASNVQCARDSLLIAKTVENGLVTSNVWPSWWASLPPALITCDRDSRSRSYAYSDRAKGPCCNAITCPHDPLLGHPWLLPTRRPHTARQRVELAPRTMQAVLEITLTP